MTTEPSVITVVLPLPPKELSPNHTVGSRGGRLGKANKTRAYRQTACYVAMEAQGHRRPFNWPAATVQAWFFFKDKRRRDKDNANGSLKAARDGLADAGVVVNDVGFTELPPIFGVDRLNQRVELVVIRGEAEEKSEPANKPCGGRASEPGEELRKA